MELRRHVLFTMVFGSVTGIRGLHGDKTVDQLICARRTVDIEIFVSPQHEASPHVFSYFSLHEGRTGVGENSMNVTIWGNIKRRPESFRLLQVQY